MSMSRSKRSIIRLSFNQKRDRHMGPGILVDPRNKNLLVRIGPYRSNESSGVKTYRMINGVLTETPSFLVVNKIQVQKSDIKVQPLQSLIKVNKVQAERVEINVEEELNCPNPPESNVKEVMQLNCSEPNVSDIVSTEDADPGFTIKIQSVQGNFAGFNEIASPKKRPDTFQIDDDVEEILPDSGETNFNERDQNWTEAKAWDEIVSDIGNITANDRCNIWTEANTSGDIPLDDSEVTKSNSIYSSVQNAEVFVEKINMLKESENSWSTVRKEIPPPKSKVKRKKSAAKVPSSKCTKNSPNIVSGYLVPDVPGIQPVPVARGGMTEFESKAITMKNPMKKNGEPIHFLNLGLANLFLNQAILKIVNFFPSDMSIYWSFVKVDGMGNRENFDGLINVGDLTKDMLITPRGVFSYADVSRNNLQRYGISNSAMHRFMEAKRRRHIITAQRKLLDLLPIDKKENTMIATIRYACEEIKRQKAESESLENELYCERVMKISLISKLRRICSNAERKRILMSLEEIGSTNPEATREIPAQYSGNDKGRSARMSLKTVKDGDRNKKRQIPILQKPQMKPNTKTASVNSLFKDQFIMLKNHIMSNSEISSTISPGSSAKNVGYSILKSSQSVLAAADDAMTTTSSNDNEDSLLGSESDLDVETCDDDFVACHSIKEEEIGEDRAVKHEVISVLDMKDGVPCFSKTHVSFPQQSPAEMDSSNMTIDVKDTTDRSNSLMKITGIPSLTISPRCGHDSLTLSKDKHNIVKMTGTVIVPAQTNSAI